MSGCSNCIGCGSFSNWVSVKDKLPEKYQKVFVADIYNGEIYYFAAAIYLGNNYFTAETDGLEASNYDGGAHISLDMEVTHWIPLPEVSEII